MKERIHIVWFKRDLRIHDHAPLHVASNRGKVLPLYVVEPAYWQLPDASARHWRFIRQSLHELNTTLSRLGQPLVKMQGDMLEVLEALRERFDISALYAHQEIGNNWTSARNQRVTHWCAQHGIEWQAFQTCQETFTGQPRLPAPARLTPLQTRIPQTGLPDTLGRLLDADESRHCQAGGRTEALKLLGSFLRERGQHYCRDMDSPLVAANTCSRLSPHLTYGTLSLCEVSHKLQETLAQDDLDSAWKRGLRAFDKRLRWHCQSLQTLQNQPELETHNRLVIFDGLRENAFNPAFFEAWRTGSSGFPLVDASMRSLRQTGWLNVRLRAVLIAFATQSLWLHWQQPAWHLAQCFTDYQPGIHYPQVQWYAGTSTSHPPRMDNPLKLSRELDPQGRFIRRWLPELLAVPDTYLHEPWNMPYSLQQQVGCIIGMDYPEPIVDLRSAMRQARARFREIQKQHPEIYLQPQTSEQKQRLKLSDTMQMKLAFDEQEQTNQPGE